MKQESRVVEVRRRVKVTILGVSVSWDVYTIVQNIFNGKKRSKIFNVDTEEEAFFIDKGYMIYD